MYYSDTKQVSIILLFHFPSVQLQEFYKPSPTKDFICSQTWDSGMTKCSDIPSFEYFGKRCNESAVPFTNNTSSNDSCINWNMYYSDCKAGVNNPFLGSITFDNIGLAWVAIFQVSMVCMFVVLNFNINFTYQWWRLYAMYYIVIDNSRAIYHTLL